MRADLGGVVGAKIKLTYENMLNLIATKDFKLKHRKASDKRGLNNHPNSKKPILIFKVGTHKIIEWGFNREMCFGYKIDPSQVGKPQPYKY